MKRKEKSSDYVFNKKEIKKEKRSRRIRKENKYFKKSIMPFFVFLF